MLSRRRTTDFFVSMGLKFCVDARTRFALDVRRRRQDDVGHLCFEGSNSRTFGVHKSAAFVFTAKNDRLKKALYTVLRGPFFAFPTSRDGFLCFDV